MTTINLTQFFFGRRKRKKNKGGGGVPTPSLPNAGKPKVSAFNYDKDTRKVTVVASVDRAGEVKTPIGDPQEFPLPPVPSAGSPLVQAADFAFDKDAKKVRLRASNPSTGEVKNNVGAWQEFPIEVPEPTPLPDAGKPFVESVTYDPDTKNVKVRAKVAQAGEVKDPEGELQEFPIHVPTPPAPPTPSLPDAGKPRVSKFNYDPTTRKVTVQASVQQAGEVKTPMGDEQTFDIQVSNEITGVVYSYDVTSISSTPETISAETPIPDGEFYAETEARLIPQDPSDPYGSPMPPQAFIYSYKKPCPEGLVLGLRPIYGAAGKVQYGEPEIVVMDGVLVINRQVSITD